jgi:hypothetical protein
VHNLLLFQVVRVILRLTKERINKLVAVLDNVLQDGFHLPYFSRIKLRSGNHLYTLQREINSRTQVGMNNKNLNLNKTHMKIHICHLPLFILL